jgi:DNA polymerase elongation subunit (family B)
MQDMLIGISPEFFYYHRKKPQLISEVHNPYFLAYVSEREDISTVRKKLIEQWKRNREDHEKLSKISSIGDIETYRSFCDFSKKRKIFKVYTKQSYYVPEISDYLFFEHNLYSAEHDIPYKQRVLTDVAAAQQAWIFDTKGKKKELKFLIYDIETTQFQEGKVDIPIDIIGYSSFDISFESEKDLETEQFSFDIIDCPSHWKDCEIHQFMARNVDEEIKNLLSFCKLAQDCDVLSGHNIAGFDNPHLLGRINWLLKNHYDQLSHQEQKLFQIIVKNHFRSDKSFHFGISSEVVQFYPCTFDTYLAARKFYSFLDDFSLKALAPFLGILIQDRLYLAPSDIRIDQRTLNYNKQDVQEQIGVTLNLIQQALPLAFTTCMPFDMLLPAGAVNIWDHMSLIRGGYLKKIMPPICRVKSISQALQRQFSTCTSKEEIVRHSKRIREQLSKDVIRVLKYGEEMPNWVTYPYIIHNENPKDADDTLNYHMPGGMTIKPDKEAHSHFIPWYYVVVADVGAMYPTILKAMNIGADTVRFARKDETPDEWIWMKKLTPQFFEKQDVVWRTVTAENSFADKGYMIGVKIDRLPGVVNRAMTGILNMIAKIKQQLKETRNNGNEAELHHLQMMYQSMKGARNAGTHGILAAPMVTGRQFNLWGAAAITTKGQIILSETLKYLEEKGIRVVYGDTDGIYLGCSRTVGNLPSFAQSLQIPRKKEDWLTEPKLALSAIEQCNKRWQKDLKYPEFELEAETHDCMIFVKHKNYLIFDSKNGAIEMMTKGNNFKGSDKANIARKVLEKIMVNVLKEIPCWDDEEEVRKKVQESIKENTKDILANLDLSQVDRSDLTLVQSVQPARRYKLNQDGSVSTFGKRAQALERLIGKPIKSRIKLKFVVTKRPLPGIANPSKSGVKPIDYMYPIDLLKNTNDIDLDWYKKMIENYVQGAFGLSDIALTAQTGLDAWM